MPEKSITVLPSGKPLGAEVRGVELRTPGDGAFREIEQAWHEHSVLLFRGQQLTDDDLIAFSRRFGALDWAPVQETGRRFVEGRPNRYESRAQAGSNMTASIATVFRFPFALKNGWPT